MGFAEVRVKENVPPSRIGKNPRRECEERTERIAHREYHRWRNESVGTKSGMPVGVSAIGGILADEHRARDTGRNG
ncbi:MAG: hypothetical protein CMJ46_07025 [Planctomyces sp.]|nr:hypothetical protein [Planctomyces sp.]